MVTPRLQFFPIVTIARFAELSGVDEQVARGWADKRRIPTIKIGRHRLVDLLEFLKTQGKTNEQL